ncbi:hypothetical protein HZH68_016226 [Vespula germanica]|uniref:Uncharacterized protein n=1 Tax=Vespula germanica TaxID=30212 RepID=A0A834J1A9_VESGE|nr:hypothetical protein HZH68_016226 [Vespula germanica]
MDLELLKIFSLKFLPVESEENHQINSKDIVFHAVISHTLREVDIPYIHVKKSGSHNSRNHYRGISMPTTTIYSWKFAWP